MVRVVQASTVIQPTSTLKVANESTVSVSHNKTLNTITVVSKTSIKNVAIFNINGQKVSCSQALSNQHSLSSSGLVPGIYIVQISDLQGNTQQKRIIVE